MTSLSEQLSAVRKSQWEAQLDALNALSSRALDNAGQLVALNMKTSRASMEQAAGAFKQILEVREPRDLFAVGAAAQSQWQQLFSYGRELLGIASGAQAYGWNILPAVAPLQRLAVPAARLAAPVEQLVEQASIASAAASTVAEEISAAAADTREALAEATLYAAGEATRPQEQPEAPAPAVTELEAEKTGAAPSEAPAKAPAGEDGEDAAQAPSGTSAAAPVVVATPDADAAIETAIADYVPPALAKPMARALNEVAPKPAAVEHPLAATLPLGTRGHVELPVVAPLERAAPQQAPAREARSARASRKK